MRNCMFELTLADLQTRVATNAEEQMLINEAKVAFEVVKDSRSVTDDVDAVAGRPTLSEATLTIGVSVGVANPTQVQCGLCLHLHAEAQFKETLGQL